MRNRPIAFLALAASFAAPVVASAQQAYGQPAGNPLSSIFSCQAGGDRQAGAAAIGALLGGIVGNKVADNERALGTALGAAIGAAAGSYIGCRMQVSDQQRAQAAAQLALDRGQTQTWTNPQTGASGRVQVVSTQPYAQPQAVPSLAGLRFASGVEPQAGYQGAGGRYTAANRVDLRAGPVSTARVVGQVQAGQSIEALARVTGAPGWLLAGRDGVAVGYVKEAALRPVGANGYAAAPLCRTFEQSFTAPGGQPETQRYTACQNAGGEWVVLG